MPWQFWSHQPPGRPNVPPACLLCLTASRTYPTALIDAATALAIAAEDFRHDFADPKVAEDFVSRVLALSVDEASAILAAVPEAGRAGCGLKGNCDFSGVAERFLNAPRLGAVPFSGPTRR